MHLQPYFCTGLRIPHVCGWCAAGGARSGSLVSTCASQKNRPHSDVCGRDELQTIAFWFWSWRRRHHSWTQATPQHRNWDHVPVHIKGVWHSDTERIGRKKNPSPFHGHWSCIVGLIRCYAIREGCKSLCSKDEQLYWVDKFTNLDAPDPISSRV